MRIKLKDEYKGITILKQISKGPLMGCTVRFDAQVTLEEYYPTYFKFFPDLFEEDKHGKTSSRKVPTEA